MGGCLALALPQAAAPDVSPTRFVGEWVGLQSWAIPDPPVNARDPQPVEIKIESIDGRLVGTLTPFMGGSDGANFVDATITGEELKASGSIGGGGNAAPQVGRRRSNWISVSQQAGTAISSPEQWMCGWALPSGRNSNTN